MMLVCLVSSSEAASGKEVGGEKCWDYLDRHKCKACREFFADKLKWINIQFSCRWVFQSECCERKTFTIFFLLNHYWLVYGLIWLAEVQYWSEAWQRQHNWTFFACKKKKKSIYIYFRKKKERNSEEESFKCIHSCSHMFFILGFLVFVPPMAWTHLFSLAVWASH